ncbi:hypothetical protein BDZ89DRAFT_1127031 [Hymenopellis radicata]|nr:hypothetical protein BDZ89DRAFT_1127031 [Hymenopellis radicata]
MRRGFLNSNKSKAKVPDSTQVKNNGSVIERSLSNDTYTKERRIMTTLPPKALANPHDGWAECFIPPSMEKAILALPGFPDALQRPLQRTYSFVDVLGKGRGMIAACKIQSGDLILEERPLVVGPTDWTVRTSVLPSLLQVERMQATQEEQMVHAALQRMTPEYRKAFEDLLNSRKDGISGPLRGRCKTNGFALRNIING